MEKMKLLPLEAAIYEGLKAGKKLSQIAEELAGMKSQNMAGRMSWLMKNGIVIRTGSKRRFVYTVNKIIYEIIPIRNAAKETLPDEGPDVLLEEMFSIKLSEEQMQIINDNRETMGRTAIAAKVGISKLQLNHVMNGMIYKKKLSGKKLDT